MEARGLGGAQLRPYIHGIKLNNMKVRYTPGTPDGLVGKTYTVEIVEMVLVEAKHINAPLLRSVRIKHANGKYETISGNKLMDSIDMIQKAVHKIVD